MSVKDDPSLSTSIQRQFSEDPFTEAISISNQGKWVHSAEIEERGEKGKNFFMG